MSHDQMVIAAGIAVLIIGCALIYGGIALWNIIWNAYDKKSRRIPNRHSFWSGQHAPRAQRGSQTRGHV